MVISDGGEVGISTSGEVGLASGLAVGAGGDGLVIGGFFAGMWVGRGVFVALGLGKDTG